jgi:hypothetical protein
MNKKIKRHNKARKQISFKSELPKFSLSLIFSTPILTIMAKNLKS